MSQGNSRGSNTGKGSATNLIRQKKSNRTAVFNGKKNVLYALRAKRCLRRLEWTVAVKHWVRLAHPGKRIFFRSKDVIRHFCKLNQPKTLSAECIGNF